MPVSKLLRVNQIDAVYLDNEIYKSLLWLVKECTSHLPPRIAAYYMPELELFVKFVILYHSVAKNGFTFGQKLLAIKYENLSNAKKILYLVFSCSSYLHRVEAFNNFARFYKYIVWFDGFIKICNFVNLSLFLKTGKYPILIDRILNLEQVYTQNAERSFGSKYLARELLWNGFIEILVYVLPLINYHKIRRMIYSIMPSRKKLDAFSDTPVLTLQTTCIYCGLAPILPHHMNCKHVFCYVCLKGNQLADSMYSCPECGHSTTSCERVSVK
ncbi:hypothetical protein PPYR_09339 [Photinus pyralis]|uniref:RING-type E3 ubiquitin transferase (cysteine targeting) n=1 Tax=Photinus pyralis TaxID=7054 RepID=A0A5N4AM10_PHOPY|nr:peroxisome biogenesis factor 2 [Photinus pyralis]KAB0798346.1 hypothetical protein PPYR_09339 [Photinus pyralis]